MERTESAGVKERAEYADEAVRRGHAVPDWLLPKEDAKHRPPHIAIKDLTAALVRDARTPRIMLPSWWCVRVNGVRV